MSSEAIKWCCVLYSNHAKTFTLGCSALLFWIYCNVKCCSAPWRSEINSNPFRSISGQVFKTRMMLKVLRITVCVLLQSQVMLRHRLPWCRQLSPSSMNLMHCPKSQYHSILTNYIIINNNDYLFPSLSLNLALTKITIVLQFEP